MDMPYVKLKSCEFFNCPVIGNTGRTTISEPQIWNQSMLTDSALKQSDQVEMESEGSVVEDEANVLAVRRNTASICSGVWGAFDKFTIHSPV
jgi:hypothetical protein